MPCCVRAMSDDVPKSIVKPSPRPINQDTGLKRPPLPKESPDPTNCTWTVTFAASSVLLVDRMALYRHPMLRSTAYTQEETWSNSDAFSDVKRWRRALRLGTITAILRWHRLSLSCVAPGRWRAWAMACIITDHCLLIVAS
jgi:hypothetical protein